MILLTGFEPFGRYKENTSERILRYFMSRENYQLKTVLLPVSYQACAEFVAGLENRPLVKGVCMMGMYSRGQTIRLERIAVNIADSNRPDESGVVAQWQTLIPQGPDGIFSTMQCRKIIRDLRERHVRINMSNTAGTFVCNALFYRMLWHFRNWRIPIGFLHVPRRLSEELETEVVQSVECILNGIQEGIY